MTSKSAQITRADQCDRCGRSWPMAISKPYPRPARAPVPEGRWAGHRPVQRPDPRTGGRHLTRHALRVHNTPSPRC